MTAQDLSPGRSRNPPHLIRGDAEPSGPLLPSDFRRTAAPAYEPQSYSALIPARVLERAKEWDSESTDPHALWLAVCGVVLGRYTQQEEFRLDVAISASGTEFVPAPVRLSLNPALTARQLVAQARLRLGAPTQKEPITAASTIALSFIDDDLEQERSTVAQERLQAIGGERDLHLVFLRHAGGVKLRAVYNARLFSVETIARLCGHIEVATEAVTGNPDVAVATLPLLKPQEIASLLEDGAGPSFAHPSRPLHRYIEAHALQRPEAVAITCAKTSLSYSELNRRANQLARYLIDHGVRAGAYVVVCMEPSPDSIMCMLAVFKAGGAYVPVEPSYPQERIAVILDDVRPKVVLSRSAEGGALTQATAPVLYLDQEGATLSGYPPTNLDADADLDSVAIVLYTSGTTGRPKGVMLSYGNLLHYILVARARYHFDERDVFPALARFTFSISLFEVLSPLVAGGRLIIVGRDGVLDFKRLIRILQDVTALHASSSLLRKLLTYIKSNGVDVNVFGGVRHVSFGGDVVSADLMEDLKRTFRTADLFVIYGCSEATPIGGCMYAVPRDRTVTKSWIGKPFDNVSVRLYDAHRNLVPVGVPGEIYLSSPGVALGYLNQPTLTEERFVRIDGQRFYRTGDMGRAASDGDIEFLGRDDFQIKLRGIRIELGEIEATLRQVAGVREAVVVERTLPTQEKGLVAYLVLSDTLAPAIKQVRAHLQARLPDYMVPSAFIVLEALPVNVNQKLDRRALPAPTPKDFELDRAIVLPRTELERDLARIWEDLLKISPIGVQDSFFDLGGESLMACAVMTKIEQQFGRTLPLSTLLSEPTIEHLARLLETGADGHCEPVLLRPGTSHTPIFLIHDGDGEILPYRNLAFLLPAGHSVYGIPPLSRAGYPLLQTRIADLVERYTAQILQLQPQGPYLLGGLCFGGFLAFEVAQELTRRGHRIDLLVLIDAAHVKAPPRSGVDNRLARLMAAGRTATPLTLRLFTLAIRVPGKMYNFAAYMTRSRLEQLKTRIRLRLLRICLDHKWPLPRMLRNIPVQTTLKFAESDYVEGALYRGSVLLLLASGVHADGVAVTEFDDRPMTANFAEPTMGWTSRAADLKVHDVPGGHGTMLQEPNVRVAAEVVAPYINEKSSSPSPPRNAETHEQMALAE